MLINTLLVRWNGGWAEVTDGVSAGLYGQMEALMGLGAVQTVDAVAEIGQAQLAVYANPREEYTLGIEPIAAGDTPYVSYLVGDTVTIEEPNAFPTDERVVSMTVTNDPSTGRAIFSPTIKDVLLSEQERISQGFKKMSNGTLRGDAKVATPVNQVPPAQNAAVTKTRPVPFIVVADNGSGDFTSIKDAIDSVPVATMTNILVRPVVAGGYTDTGQIDITGKRFTITSVLGSVAAAIPLFGSLASLPLWRMDGFTASSGTSQVAISGMQVQERTGTVVLFAGVGTMNIAIADSYVLFFAGIIESAVGIRRLHIRDSDLSGRLVRDDATMSSAHLIRIDSCHESELLDGTVTWLFGTRFEFSNNTIFTDAGGSGDIHTFLDDTSFTDNLWRGTAGNRIGITWAPVNTERAFRFTGNIAGQGGSSVESDLVVDYSNAGAAATVLVAGNTMREMNVTVDGPAVPSRQDTYISGAYHTLTVNASNVRADVALNLATDTGLTALTVAGDQNLIVAALNGGTGAVSTPYAVAATADRNVFVLSGETSFTAAGTDVGTNNQRASLVAL